MSEQSKASANEVQGEHSHLQKLITGCYHKDRLAESQLYKYIFDFMYRVAIRYEKNHDDAVFIINEAFYKLLIKIHLYNRNAPFYPWAKTILVHCIINKFKKENRVKRGGNIEIVSVEDEHASIAADEEIDRNISLEQVVAVLQRLPECTRKVFNLYVVEGYSHKEIAEALRISVNTSKWHLSHGRKKLIETVSQLKESLQP